MKRTFLPMIIICFVICTMFNACKDVVDADENVQKTLLTYNKILDDQTHSVIMPLKTGNTWIYQVTRQAPLSIYYDTIVVYEPVTINGEKWFKVKYPMISETEIIKMTNTDVGLWFKCDSCGYNYAPYPVISTEPLILIDTVTGRLQNGTMRNFVLNFYNSISKSYTVQFNKKITKGIFYNMFTKNNVMTEITSIRPYNYDNIFVPDSGLFRHINYTVIDSVTKNVFKTYELIDCSISR